MIPFLINPSKWYLSANSIYKAIKKRQITKPNITIPTYDVLDVNFFSLYMYPLKSSAIIDNIISDAVCPELCISFSPSECSLTLAHSIIKVLPEITSSQQYIPELLPALHVLQYRPFLVHKLAHPLRTHQRPRQGSRSGHFVQQAVLRVR